MRILHVAGRLSARGGADWHLLGVLSALSAKHDTHLAVEQLDGSAAPPAGIAVHRLDGLASREACPAHIGALAAAVRPDLVHLHNVVNPTVLCEAGRYRSLITVQDHRFFCPGRGKWRADGRCCTEQMDSATCESCFDHREYFRGIYRLTEQRLNALRALPVVVLSSYMKRELTRSGLAAKSIHVIPPFVHGLDPTAAPEGGPCALFVGRLVDAKGVRDAVAALRLSQLNLPLVFAGTGPLRQQLERQGGDVLGWIAHQRLSGLYRSARVVLMPSRWQEPFGIVGLEALAMGCPVATWDSGGVREWHGDRELVAWGDVTGLASRARSIAGRQARAPAGFEREDLMERLERLYESLVLSACLGN